MATPATSAIPQMPLGNPLDMVKATLTKEMAARAAPRMPDPKYMAPDMAAQWLAPTMPTQTDQYSTFKNLGSQYGAGLPFPKDVNYAISRKETGYLYKFDDQVEKFDHWMRKMVDHVASSTQRYRTPMSKKSERKQAILMSVLLSTEIDRFIAWEVSC